MKPPQQLAVVELEAGRDTPVELTYRPAGGATLGGAEVTMLTVQLNAAPVFDEQAEFERAVSLAAESDVAVVVVGTNEEVESEGFDRTSLALPGRQDELVSAVAAANPRTVVVVNSGAPVLLPWADDVAAVLVSWFPGQEFGNALGDVLTGSVGAGWTAARYLAVLGARAAGSEACEWRAAVRRRSTDRLPLVSRDRPHPALPLRARAGLHHLGVRGNGGRWQHRDGQRPQHGQSARS